MTDALQSVDDAFSERWAERLNADSRPRMAAWLRDWADSIDEGTADVDALILVLTKGDVHHVHWRGEYQDGLTQRHAFHAPDEEYFGLVIKHRYDAVKAAENRETMRLKQEAEEEAFRLSKPYVCRCRQRFGTAKGHLQHSRIMDRRAWGEQPGMARIEHDDGSVGWINVESAEQYGWSLAGWVCVLPDPEAHVLAEVYRGADAS